MRAGGRDYRRATHAAVMVGIVAVVSAASAAKVAANPDPSRALPSLPHAVAITESPILLAKARHEAEVRCLAQVMYFEAWGEGIEGEKAVAEVVLARVRDDLYPGTVCGVVLDGAGEARRRCQFSFACDGKSDQPQDRSAWARLKELADRILIGAITLPGKTREAIAFHRVGVAPAWAERMQRTAAIGRHIFYRRPGSPTRAAPALAADARGPSKDVEPDIETGRAVRDGS